MKHKAIVDIPNEIGNSLTHNINKVAMRNKQTGQINGYGNIAYYSKSKEVLEKAAIIGGALSTVLYVGDKVVKKIRIIKLDKTIQNMRIYANLYLMEFKNKKINIDTIDNLLKQIDKIERLIKRKKNIEISSIGLKTLLDMIYGFAYSIYEIDKENMEKPTHQKDNIIYLKDYLNKKKDKTVKVS